MMAMLHLLPRYDLEQKAKFTTYAHYSVQNVIRNYQMQKSWLLPSLSTYKKIRTAAWMQHHLENALEEFMKKYRCDEDTADRYFREAKCLHNRESLYVTDEDGDTAEEACADDSWDYLDASRQQGTLAPIG